MTECRHVIVTGGGMEISCAQDECPHCLTKRIAELEGLLSKQVESDNNWKCPKCGGKLTVVLDCTNRRCEWYSMTGAELRARLSALEAENARLKSEIAQHEWWGGGGQ